MYNFVLINELGDLVKAMFPPARVRQRLGEMTSATGVLALLIIIGTVVSIVFSVPGYTAIVPGGIMGAPMIGMTLAIIVGMVMMILISLLSYAILRGVKKMGATRPDPGYIVALLLLVGTIGYADYYVMTQIGVPKRAQQAAGEVIVADQAHPYSTEIHAEKIRRLQAMKRISWCSIHGTQGHVDEENERLVCPRGGEDCTGLEVSSRVNRYNRSIWASVQSEITSASEAIARYQEQGQSVISQRIHAAEDNNNRVSTDRANMEEAGKAVSTFIYIGMILVSLLLTNMLLTYYQEEGEEIFEAITAENDERTPVMEPQAEEVGGEFFDILAEENAKLRQEIEDLRMGK